MKIGLISDLHNRFGNEFPDIPKDIDVLVCAGDMGDPYRIKEKLKSFDVTYVYIAGNHSAYGLDYNEIMVDVFNNTDGCYENHTIELMGKKIHMCTMWSEIKDTYEWNLYEAMLNDFRMIRGIDTFEEYTDIHDKSISFLNKNVSEGDIVVTHHSPSYLSMHPKWVSSSVNFAFHNNLDDFILERSPSLWMHGHIHDQADYMIGKTRIVCNPKGYPNENYGDYKIKVIEV